MKIVVVTGSPHKAGTSALLADKFIEGAQSKGHDVFRFNAAFEDIHPCRGCDACGMNGPCVQKDAIEEKLIHKLVDCDMIVLVTPLYYFGFSAQLKTVIDRFYSRTGSIHKKKSALLAQLDDDGVKSALYTSLPIHGVAGPGTDLCHRLRLSQRNRRHGIPGSGFGIREESVTPVRIGNGYENNKLNQATVLTLSID